MTETKTKKKVAYIITSVISEFVLREMVEIGSHGVDLYLFALKNKPDGLEEKYPLVKQLPRPAFYSPYFLSFPVIKAQFYFLLHSPLTYLLTFLKLLNSSKNISFVIKSLIVFPKSAYYARIIKESGIPRIHAHWATISTTSAMTIARLLKTEFGFTGHAWDIFTDTYALRRKMKESKYIVTCTKYNKRYLANLCKEIDPGKIKTNYHGINLSHYTPLDDKGNARFKILSVGAMVAKKGFKYLLEALFRLREEGLDFEAEIYGRDGPQKKNILSLLSKYHLNDVVAINGFIPHTQVIQRMRSADLFVLPCVRHQGSRLDQDGLPNVLIESLALEVPVVSTDISGIPELVVNMETGIAVPPEDVQALADAIKTLYHDRDLRKRLGENGRKKVQQKFDLTKNVAELADIILS